MTSTGPEVPGTRDRVLALVRAAPAPITASALATALGLHVTTARFHLDHLERAGLIERRAARRGTRGRPAQGYRPRGGDVDGARTAMIAALAAALPDTDSARIAGRQWADQLPVTPGAADTTVLDALDRIGFDPTPTPEGDLLLRACPFRDAARMQTGVVCGTHLGLAQGLADRAEPGAVTVELRPFVTPELCVLHTERSAPPPA